jgi:hypothetical protein
MISNPYKQYENSAAWKILDQAISDLVANQDLVEQTARTHIVGYMVKQLVEAGVV